VKKVCGTLIHAFGLSGCICPWGFHTNSLRASHLITCMLLAWHISTPFISSPYGVVKTTTEFNSKLHKRSLCALLKSKIGHSICWPSPLTTNITVTAICNRTVLPWIVLIMWPHAHCAVWRLAHVIRSLYPWAKSSRSAWPTESPYNHTNSTNSTVSPFVILCLFYCRRNQNV
jgi:hypothetical protein